MEKIWFVTGAARGFGLILVRQLLKEGIKVAGTSRDLNALIAAAGEQSADFLPLKVDLLDEDNVSRALYDTVKYFGKVDVIVNSAKYGLAGSIEELTDKETRRNFDVNVFGTLNVVRAALPFLREQQSGHVFNIASVGRSGGGAAGYGIYRATELAVLGFSESLAAEVKPFGIKVTTVAPGYLRTSLLFSNSLAVPKRRIAEYKMMNDRRPLIEDGCDDDTNADIEKAVATFIDVAAQPEPPLLLFLGHGVCDIYQMKARTLDTA